MFDPNARPELWDSDEAFGEQVREMLAFADVVKASPEDLRAAGFEGESPESLAAAVAERGPHTVLLTLGDAGAFARSTDDAPWVSGAASHGGYGVESVADTTGAGDAFTAGAMAAFAVGADGETDDPEERSLSAVLAFANAVAAVTTTAPGAMTALPTREAVREFREKRE
jgi:fructokinase